MLVVLSTVVEREAINAWQKSSGPSWQLDSLICLGFCRLVLMSRVRNTGFVVPG